MMMKSMAVLLVVAVTCSAWKLKPDDTPKLKQELEATAANDLDKFVSGDASSRSPLFQAPLDVAKAVKKNDDKVLGGLEPIEGILVKLSSGEKSIFDFAKMRAMQLLTNFIDGNRDNFSYYKLDAVREWAQRRLDRGVSGADAATLRDVAQKATVARDSLDAMAQAFVQGIKDIKELTSHIGKEDKAKIAEVARKIVAVGNEKKPGLVDNVNNLISLLEDRVSH